MLLNTKSSSLAGNKRTVDASDPHLDDRMDLDAQISDLPMPGFPIRTAAKQVTQEKGREKPTRKNDTSNAERGDNVTSMNNLKTLNQSNARKNTVQAQVSSRKKKQMTSHAQAKTSTNTPAPTYRKNKPQGPARQKPTKEKQADTVQNDEMELDIEQLNIPIRSRISHKAVIPEPGSTVLKVNVDFDPASKTSLYLDAFGNKQERIDESFLQVIQQYTVMRKEIVITVCYQCPTKETSRQRRSQFQVLCSLVKEINKVKDIKYLEVRFKMAKGDGYGPQLFDVVPFYDLDYKFWSFRFFRDGWMQSQTLKEGSDMKSRILKAAEQWNKPKNYRPTTSGQVFYPES